MMRSEISVSVRVDGCMDFHRWYWENYGDVSSIVSDEIYTEYLHYKSRQHNRRINNFKIFIILLEYVAIVIVANILLLKFIGVV